MDRGWGVKGNVVSALERTDLMPSIHVIYDPNDRLTPPSPEMRRKMKVSSVVLSLAAPITHSTDVIGDIATQLATLLLAEISAGGEG